MHTNKARKVGISNVTALLHLSVSEHIRQSTVSSTDCDISHITHPAASTLLIKQNCNLLDTLVHLC